MTEQDGKDWFSDQYEKLIGKPLHRNELTSEEVLKRLKDSAKYRQISEAKSYLTPVPLAGNVYHLEWKDPQVTKCMCPDQDCTCKGGVMLPRRKIPRGTIYTCNNSHSHFSEKYYKSPLARKLMQRFRQPVPPPSRNFMQRLADVFGVEASIYRDLQRNDILSVRGAEFCTSRCIRYYGAGNFPNFKHLQDKQKLLNDNKKAPLSDNVQDSNEDIRICDGYSCTVTTQTMIGPDGQFVFGNYSHVLFGTLDETVVRDIEGTELHISSYKCMRNNSHYATHKPCNLDNLLSWRDLINMRELKNHLSLIKRNIYSSIFELKEANVPDENLTTQCEEKCVSRKSSETISIATPYKGVMIKVKKDPNDMPPNQIQEEKPQIQNSSNVMPKVIVPTNSKGLNMHLKETSSVFTEIKQDMPLYEENIYCPSQIELAEHKTIRDILNQEQTQTAMQTERSNFINVTDSITKNKKSSHEKIEIQSAISPTLADVNSALKIVDKKDTVNKIENNNGSNQIDSMNIKGNQLNIQNILQETVMSTNSQKIANVSRHLYENIENGEVLKQHFSKTRLFREIKKIENTGNEISKNNIRNFIKKRLYGLSFEHLQKIKIKNFAKSYSYTNNSDKISNNKELKSNNDVNETLKQEIKQDNSNLPCNDAKICDVNTHLESKPNSDLTNFKAMKFHPESSLSKEDLIEFDQLKSIMDMEGNKLQQHDDGIYINMNEVCTLDKDTAVSNDDVCKVIKISDNKIHSVSIYKNHAELNNPGCGNDSDLSKLLRLENKNTSVSGRKSNVTTLRNIDHDINEDVAGVSNYLENNPAIDESKKSASVIKKISNVSIQLKKVIYNKIDHSIKSLPERTFHKHIKKSNNARINMSEIDHRKCSKSGKKESKEEPKTSEKEVFSIQYSALLS